MLFYYPYFYGNPTKNEGKIIYVFQIQKFNPVSFSVKFSSFIIQRKEK